MKPETFSAPMCYACLSSDRKLYALGEFSNIFIKLIDNNFTACTGIVLCWECSAVLRKVKLFKDKVDQAQILLSFHRHSWKNTIPESLSTLVTKTIDHHYTDITEETLEHSKPETIVKVETDTQEDERENKLPIDTDNYDAEVFDYEPNDYIHLEDIKTEDSKLILNIKSLKNIFASDEKKPGRKKGEKHSRRYIRIGIQQKATSKSVPVCYGEVSRCMERDRRSEYFISLKHTCSQCVLRVSSSTKKQHWKEWHCPNRKYTCDLCTCTFRVKNALSKHLIKTHSRVRECSVCGFRCYSRDYMKHHLELHSKSVQCRQCLHELPTISDFYEHDRALHRQYRCDHCPKLCTSKRVMEAHIIRKHLPIVCKECNVTFKHYNNYQNHVNLKHVKQMTEEAFCVPCNRQFSNRQEYRNHVNSAVAHQGERRGRAAREKVQCPECPKTYMKRHSMLNHYRYVHQKESRYRCEHCGIQLLNRTKLVEHVKFKHEGAVREKNQLCTICGRKFSTRRILRHHVRTHTGERPHHCVYCGAKFAQQYAMHSHVKFVHLKARRRPDYTEFTEGQLGAG